MKLLGRIICFITRKHLRGKQSGIDILCDDGAIK